MTIKSTGILGTGKMGQAIIRGLAKTKPQIQIRAYDIHPSKEMEKHCSYVDDPRELEKCEMVLLCIKPQDFSNLTGIFSGTTNFISIAAGIQIETIQKIIPGLSPDRIARAMPNLAADIGQSATGVYSQNSELAVLTSEIFATIGKTWILNKESEMHIITALCGSGPAWVYSFLHAMAEGAVMGGINYDTALEMAIQTVTGSVQSLKDSSEHPCKARNKITSPAGTTIAGLYELESGAFHSTVMNAISSACNRSQEIANNE